jgi:nucleoside-triphosphatase THEP1
LPNAQATKNIFLTGKKHVGKTTALNAFLAALAPENAPGGFITEWNAARDCLRMHALSSGEAAVIAQMSGGRLTAHPDVFDTFGVSALNASRSRPLVIMDELGRLEAAAHVFQAAVLELLADPRTRVLGVLQQGSGEFTQTIAALPNVTVLEVTELNRNGIPSELEKHFIYDKD